MHIGLVTKIKRTRSSYVAVKLPFLNRPNNEHIYRHSIIITVYLTEDPLVITLNQMLIVALSTNPNFLCNIVV
jgi:hypothetical protein